MGWDPTAVQHIQRGRNLATQPAVISGQVSKRGAGGVSDESAPVARDAYLAWARTLLLGKLRLVERRDDAKAGLQDVWRLHADGKSNAEVATALGVTRLNVQHAVARVMKMCGPPPILNPWRRSGRYEADLQRSDPTAVARLARIAVGLAPLERLREAVADDPVLTRLLPQEGTSMANENKRVPVPLTHYDVIRLRSGEGVLTPGNPVKKSELIDIDGRPHAGGIDVQLPIMKGETQVATKVVTVPWWKIASTERTQELEGQS